MNAVNRVAINTILQYIQLIANVFLGLFTVRIILNALGTVDYGIYNLIGGVITLITFISTSLSQTSVRFLSVSIGKADIGDIRHVFASCFSMHFYMAISLCLFLEIVGLFLFDGFLNIPAERLFAARVVFHCMTITLFLQVARTPFSAMVTVHEHFHISTTLAILESTLKLIIALIIARSSFDRLILYGVLMGLITVLSTSCYLLYNHFEYKAFIWLHFKPISSIKEVFSFAGWTLLDVFGTVANRQGYAVILNKFFGPVTNSVFALASQVEGHLYMVSNSVINTMKPQIMKSYGAGDLQRTFRLSMTAGKFGFSMMSLLSIPILITLPELLDFWLEEVPEGTVFFARMMVIACMFEQLTKGLVYANQAIGNIKWFSIVVSGIRVMALPSAILLFICGFPAHYGMFAYTLFETLAAFSRIIVMKYSSGLNVKEYLHSVYLQILPPFIVSVFSGIIVYHFLKGFWGVVCVTITSTLLYCVVFLRSGLSDIEKTTVLGLLNGLKGKFVKKSSNGIGL